MYIYILTYDLLSVYNVTQTYIFRAVHLVQTSNWLCSSLGKTIFPACLTLSCL